MGPFKSLADNWDKLREGMSFYEVDELIAPFSDFARKEFSSNRLLNQLGPQFGIQTGGTYSTNLYTLKFANGELKEWIKFDRFDRLLSDPDFRALDRE